ncbi:MAG: 3-hydroxyacyl-CoA dehydrogenase NAD-binding domain-containing protein [Gemmatimonadota bacterium]|nr:3-hydroxyacyl-CoA dehydrogenase NAD-binding domain-containing protein [Gemmatimonadota bacterium]
MTSSPSRPTDSPLRLEIDLDGIGSLVFERAEASVNTLSSGVLRRLDELLGELESRIANGQLTALVVRSGKEASFIAGADVREIADVRDAEEGRAASAAGQRIFRRLERLRVPTVAFIDGTCLGGGTELALHCDFRVATDRSATRIGLPEVRLGIVPGFGGCVKLPRTVGLQRALEMILSGRPVPGARAARIGLVDRVVPAHAAERPLAEFVADVIAGRVDPAEPRLGLRDRLLERTAPGRKLLFALSRRRVAGETKGFYPAPGRAIDVLEATAGASLDEAYAEEARALGELVTGEVSRSLVRVFLLSQAAKKELPAEQLEAADRVESVAVIGAGVMGGEIAELAAAADRTTVLKDIDQEALDAGLRHAAALLDKAVRARVFNEEERGLKLARISGTLSYDEVAGCDLAVEAVVERLPVKQQVFRELESAMGPDAVLASNTSALSIAAIAARLERPGRAVGLHFFNPVHKMPLVEVVRAEGTDDRALATAFRFVLDTGKTPVIVADRPGFLVNRVLAPYLGETGRLLEEGVPVETIDAALRAFGMPMGPCRLLDEVGFDVAVHAGREMAEGIGERLAPSSLLDRLIEEGRLGRKNGRGFYRYEDGRSRGADPALTGMLPPAGPEPDAEEIRRRCLLPMVNEAARALDEEVVASADMLDLAMIFGTGFPPFRGGLLRWADTVGLARVCDDLVRLAEAHGDRFAPAPLLERLAGRNGTFTHPS